MKRGMSGSWQASVIASTSRALGGAEAQHVVGERRGRRAACRERAIIVVAPGSDFGRADPTGSRADGADPPTSSARRRPRACCCSCTATAPTSATSAACSRTSTPRAGSSPCCPAGRSRRRPGFAWYDIAASRRGRRRPTRTSCSSRSHALDDLLDEVCAEHDKPRSEAIVGGFSQGAALAVALAYRASERAAPGRPCSR